MRQILTALALLLLTQSPAFADAKLDDIDNTHSDCTAGATATVETKGCNADALSQADAYLNGVYGTIIAGLKNPDADEFEKKDNDEKLNRLKAAQRAWIAYRDTQCELEGVQSLGGTGEGVYIGECLYRTTAERVKTLLKLFVDEPQ